MQVHKISNCCPRTILKLALVFTAVFFSLPAQTGQNAPGSAHSEIVSFSSLKTQHTSSRRVAADVCLTEVGISENLSTLGFHHILLGQNEGTQHMLVDARYGDDAYELVLDRCTGQVQSVRADADMI